ncbi:MAG: TetR/AcrR family transcriptional regulator [Vibrio sp.]
MSKTSSRSDGATTKQKILTTAIGLFAKQGFVNTPNKQIAEQAEVDLASINYHFKNRNGLYQAALIKAHSKLFKLENLQAIEALEVSAEEKLKLIIGSLCHSEIRHENAYGQVLAREILSPTSNLLALLTHEVQPKLLIVIKVISELTGIPLSSPKLKLCLLNVGGPCLMMLLASGDFPGPLKEIKQVDSDYLTNHMYTFCLAGLKAVSEMYREMEA